MTESRQQPEVGGVTAAKPSGAAKQSGASKLPAAQVWPPPAAGSDVPSDVSYCERVARAVKKSLAADSVDSKDSE